jgi:hypothetical protein
MGSGIDVQERLFQVPEKSHIQFSHFPFSRNPFDLKKFFTDGLG